jgi:hypothetical protein
VIVATGFGLRIREMIADRASQIVRAGQTTRRYSDTQFAAEVGLVERGKASPITTLGEWKSERNSLGASTALAMEVVLERPGAAVYIVFGVWPTAADGSIIPTPGAVRPPEAPARLPRPSDRGTKAVAAGGGRKRRKRPPRG